MRPRTVVSAVVIGVSLLCAPATSAAAVSPCDAALTHAETVFAATAGFSDAVGKSLGRPNAARRIGKAADTANRKIAPAMAAYRRAAAECRSLDGVG